MSEKSNRFARWSIALGACALASVLALCVLTLIQGRHAASQAADIFARNVVEGLGAEIARNFEFFDLSLQGAISASQDPALDGLNAQARQLAIFDYAAKAKYLNAITLLDENGLIIEDSMGRSAGSGSLADREYFQAHRHASDLGLYLSRPFQSRLMKDQEVIAISRRINKPDGSFGGVAAGVVRLEYFGNALRRLAIGSSISVNLIRRDGSLILSLPRNPELADIDLQMFAAQTVEGVTRFEGVSADGMWRRFTAQAVAGLPMGVVVGLTDDDIYGGWRAEEIKIVALTTVMIIALGTLAVLLTRESKRRQRTEERLRQGEARYRLLADHSNDAIILRDAKARRTYSSPAFYRMVGYTPEQLGERSFLEDLDDEGKENTRMAYERLCRGESPITTGFAYTRPDGKEMWLEAISTGLYDSGNALTEIVTNMRDVTDRKRAEEELAATALTDSLTRLGNRRAFEERMTLEWRRATRNRSELCVLMIDADHFKSLNDSFGHIAGDAALRLIGHNIQTCLRRPADFGARYGGEEFVVILPDTDLAGGFTVAEFIRLAVEKARTPSHPMISVAVSLGVVVAAPKFGDDWLDVVSDADAALYRAKTLGRNRSSTNVEAEDRRLSA